jgi:hypothetical protein
MSSLGSSDPCAPFMNLSDTLEPVAGRLPLGAEILIAEGLARKATHYNLTITGPRFIT